VTGRTIIVCGGRNFTNIALLNAVLDSLHEAHPIGRVTHGASRGADRIPRATLLRAGGLSSLDTSGEGATSGQTNRYSGLVLLVTLEYSNPDFNEGKLRYSYRVVPLEEAEVANLQAIAPAVVAVDLEALSRKVVERHGVSIVVGQAGEIGRFELRTLLITAVTSMGLLAVASSIVNCLAFRVLPMRHIYTQMRLYVSPDFSDVASLPDRQLELFKYVDLVNPAPSVFTAFTEEQTAGGTVGSTMKYIKTSKPAAAEANEGSAEKQGVNDKDSLLARMFRKPKPVQRPRGFFGSLASATPLTPRSPGILAPHRRSSDDSYEEPTGVELSRLPIAGVDSSDASDEV
jgi:hypothetical protein